MGFKDVDRALSLNRDHGAGLSLAESAVLVVIAHHTKDATHQTIIGQQRIAAEVGCDVKTVQRAVGVLTLSGIINRQPRIVNGFKSTDTITFNHEWQGTVSRPTKSRQTQSRPTIRPASTDSPSPREGLKVRAEENTQEITQRDHSVHTPAPIDAHFSSFWEAWPRKVGKPTARGTWERVLKKHKVDPRVVVDAARAYAENPHRPPQQFIPHPTTWLNRAGWEDELEGPPQARDPHPVATKVDKGRAAHEELMRRAAASNTPTLENAS